MRGYEIEGGSGACELCRRPAERLTRHHLLPRTRHRNKRNKKTSDRREIHRTVDLCGPCHRHVHVTTPGRDLEREYNTAEALKYAPTVLLETQGSER